MKKDINDCDNDSQLICMLIDTDNYYFNRCSKVKCNYTIYTFEFNAHLLL